VTLRALIFDVDGTLADTEELHRRAFNQAFMDHMLGWEWTTARYRQLLAVTGGKERIAQYIALLDIDDVERQRLQSRIGGLHAAKTAHYVEHIRARQVHLRRGVEQLLADARRMHLRLAIASTTTRPNIEALLSAALGPGANVWFDVISCGDDVTKKKPAPDIYLHALDRLQLPADECAAFEDSAHGVRAARAAGLFTVVTPTEWTRGEDFAAADLVLDGLDDLDLARLVERFAMVPPHLPSCGKPLVNPGSP
jgi:HAD superfamily hydrolase (TIGR01509 family)